MTEQERTVGGTVAEFEAWYTAWAADQPDDEGPDPAQAAATLADLFARAQRVGGDLHDPSAELQRFLVRDLARDEAVDHDAYDLALMTTTRYLLFLRAHGLWRRSERAVQAVWDVTSWSTQRPLGLPSLGETVDETIAAGLRLPPSYPDLVAQAVQRPFVAPLRLTLDTLVARGRLTRSEVAALLGVGEDAEALEIWVRGLEEADLIREDLDTHVVTPRAVVVDAGGCPPPSGQLIETLVSGLVRSALAVSVEADLEAGLTRMPRGMATLMGLVAATDDTYYVAADEDDSEETTVELAAMFVAEGLPEGEEDERSAPFAVAVLDRLEALERFGLLDRTSLPRGGEALLAPDVFRHAVIRAVSDYTGCVGTSDESIAWQPVELRSPRRADTGVDLHVSFEHDPQVWRRVRVSNTLPLSVLHSLLAASFGWRGLRRYVFSDASGTRRFAPAWMLRSLTADDDLPVTDSAAAQVGAVLVGTGTELRYAYGEDANPWRVVVRVERAMSGLTDPVAPIDGAGRVPGEPTFYAEAIEGALPAGITIPPELEAAWGFMEGNGWRTSGSDGAEMLTPGDPSRGAPGMLFVSGLTLDGFFPEGSAAPQRLLSLGLTSPNGSCAALWLDDDGATRVVGLGSEGEAYMLAASPREFLALLAVGYRELTDYQLGLPPEDATAIEAVSGLRAWLRQHGEVVPSEWPAVGRDVFTAWVAAQRGEPERQQPVVPVTSTQVTGEVGVVLGALGGADGGPEALAFAGLLGVSLTQGELRRSAAELRARGVEVEIADGAISTIWLRPQEYPRPQTLIDGLDRSASRRQVEERLGTPEASGPAWVRYAVDGRYLHLQLGEHGVELITAMVQAP